MIETKETNLDRFSLTIKYVIQITVGARYWSFNSQINVNNDCAKSFGMNFINENKP